MGSGTVDGVGDEPPLQLANMCAPSCSWAEQQSSVTHTCGHFAVGEVFSDTKMTIVSQLGQTLCNDQSTTTCQCSRCDSSPYDLEDGLAVAMLGPCHHAPRAIASVVFNTSKICLQQCRGHRSTYAMTRSRCSDTLRSDHQCVRDISYLRSFRGPGLHRMLRVFGDMLTCSGSCILQKSHDEPSEVAWPQCALQFMADILALLVMLLRNRFVY